MEKSTSDRRGFLKKVLMAAGGLAAVPMLSRPAQAGRSHWRGWGGYGYGTRRSGFRGGYGGYGGYRAPGYGGYGGVPYNRGFYGAPYGGGGIYAPYGGYGGYGGYGVGIPILKNDERRAIDALTLLEC